MFSLTLSQCADRTRETIPGTLIAGACAEEISPAMDPKYIQHVHPALSLATLVLLALAVAGVLLATGLLQ
jgi:hypothetical protein